MSLNSSKFLSKEEDARLLSLLHRHENRDTLMLLLLRRYGMRAGELLSLRVKDLNSATKTMMVPGSKGSNPREFPLSDELWARLSAQARHFISDTDRVFLISYIRLHQIWGEYRPVKKHLHSLRHTLGIEMYQKTKDIRLVQKILGHRSISNTMIYLDFAYTQDEFRKALVG